MRGALHTMASVNPVSTVICGGIARPGLTSVWKVPRHSPPRTLTAPISVIMSSLPAAAGGLEVEHAERDVAEGDAALVEQVVEAALSQHPSRHGSRCEARTYVRRQEHPFDFARRPLGARKLSGE